MNRKISVGMAEFGGFPVDVLPLGDVAAQGQHIIHAVVAQALEILGNVVLRRADAGQVGHRFELEFFLQMGNDFQRGVLAGAARPVRNGREQRCAVLGDDAKLDFVSAEKRLCAYSKKSLWCGRSSGRVVPPLAAGRSPTNDFLSS